jgi:hypothetical protein
LNEKDYDIKFASLVAIEMNNSPKRKMILEKYLSEEYDEELQNRARNIMNSIN